LAQGMLATDESCGASSGIGELLASSLRRLGWLTPLLAYIWAWPAMAVYHRTPDWANLVGPILLAAAGLLSLRRSASYRASALALAAGLCSTVAVEMAMGHAVSAGVLALSAVLVAGLFLGARAALAISLLLGLGALAGRIAWPSLVPQEPAQAVARQALLGGILLWAAGGNIYRAMAWAEANERRSWQQAREAMSRQAELQRTAKAIRDMYALLERTNRELEIARREAEEAKEVKARFAANISHELRTPLNLILGFSRVMYQTPEVYGPFPWPAELRLDVHEVYRASRHLLGMIDDILDLSRIQAQRLPLKREPTDLAAIFNDATATARGLLRGSAVRLSLHLPPSLPEVVVDAGRIRQVLLNLLGNAIRFTDSGEISVTAQLIDGEVEVAVADSGVGIPTDDLAAIFEEFSQARGPVSSDRGGAGLGLAVCKQFVQLHGGRISVESQLGQGSTFRFTLPLPEGGRARSRLSYYAPDGWSAPLPPDKLGASVVVLAPEVATARMLARGLEGYCALPLAEEELSARLVEAEHPRAIVVARDPLHPGEGASVEALWRVTGRPDLAIIECEVPTEAAARERLGVDAFLVKPVQSEDLLAAIRACKADARRFLVVDDDPGFRALMRRFLSAAIADVSLRLCASADEGIESLRQEPCDLLLLDLVMPGSDGLEFLNRARSEGLLGAAKVVVTSGAPYVEELTALFPTKLHFSKKTPPRGSEWFRCISALVDAAPPDYSAPTGAEASAAGPLPSLAS